MPPRLLNRRSGSLALGASLAVAGVAVVVAPLLGVLERGHADTTSLSRWHRSSPSTGASSSASPASCGSSADYALVTFPSLSGYGYAGVAGDGTWDLLLQRTMVHYQGTASPGQQGNMMIGFHREPEFQHIDELGIGGTVDVQDRSCQTWHYRITQRWVLSPQQVTQLSPTTDAEVTLITCTPWWQDTDRIVWRGVLLDDAGQPVSPVVPAPGWTPPAQPVVGVPFLPTSAPTPSTGSKATPTAHPGQSPTSAPASPWSSQAPTPNDTATQPSASASDTPTAAPTPTLTPVPTPTPTPAPTPTPTPVPTSTPTPVPTPTPTPSPTPKGRP